jgi:hypothetical protein
VNVLTERQVPYQLVGGLAAHAYGAKRDLVDIDFYIDGAGFAAIMPLVEEHHVFGPVRHRDAIWDLVYMQLLYGHWQIELAAAETTRFYDRERQVWADANIDFHAAEMCDLYGVTIAVMPKKKLVDYKHRLGREVDLIDIEQMNSGGPEG